MSFKDFLNLDYVSTFMGTIFVTMLIVQGMKELPGIKKIPTKYFTYIIAFINILVCSLLTKTFSISSLYLMFLNALLVTFAATGGFDFTFKNVIVKEKDIPSKKINPTGQITNKID